jgi:hypothetical protein
VRSQLRDLANRHDPPLRLVVAANTSLSQLFWDSKDSPFEGICQEIMLRPWSEEIIRKFITKYLENNLISFNEREIQQIISESQGHPQTIMRACHQMYNGKLRNINL